MAKILLLDDLGLGSLALSLLKQTLEHEIILVSNSAELSAEDEKLIVIDKARNVALAQMPEVKHLQPAAAVIPTDNSWRGGSIGKGGKVKYRRG